MEDGEPDIIDKVFEFESKSKNLLSHYLNSIKSALMGTLFVMAKDSTLTFTSNLIGMVIDSLQLLAFTFNGPSEFPWNQSYAAWFSLICEYAKLEFYISEENSLQNLIIYIVCVLFVFLNLVAIAIVAYRFINKKVQSVFLLKMIRSVSSLITTVLFMPFLSQFLIIFSCAIGNMDFPGCPSEQRTLLIFSSTFISILFGVFSTIVAASFYEQDYTSEDVSARPHARIELIFLLFKGLISVIFTLYEQPKYNALQIGSILATGIPMTVIYVMFLPFYHYKTTVVQAQFVAVYSWSGICVLIAKLENDSEDAGPITLFYLGSICIWVLTKHACDWRRDALRRKTLSQLRNPYEIELHTRFFILEKAGCYKTQDEELLTEVEDFYYQAERKFPDSSLLKLFVAQFHLTYRDRDEAIPKLEQAEKRKPALDEQFIIYKTRQNVKKDAITLVTFSSYLESAHRAEISTLSAQLSFWRELKQKSPSFESLVSLTKTISKNIDTAGSHYAYLVSIDRTHRKMLPMYVYFLEDVMHRNDSEVKNLRNRVQDLKGDAFGGKKIMTTPLTINPPQLTISCDKVGFGLISKVTSDIMTLLQLPKAKLINQVLPGLMPFPFSEIFYSHLRLLYENWDHPIKSIPVYLLDNEGYVIPVSCSIFSESAENIALAANILEENQSVVSEQSMLEVISPTEAKSKDIKRTRRGSVLDSPKAFTMFFNPDYKDTAVILLNADMRISYINRAARDFFSLTPEDKNVKEMKEYIPNLEELMTKAKKFKTYSVIYLASYAPVQTFILLKSGAFTRIKIDLHSLSYEKSDYYILHITEPSAYSKSTLRFFDMFIKFLETYLKAKGVRNMDQKFTLSKMADCQEDSSISGKENFSDVTGLMRRVRSEVEEKNQVFSPELKTLNRLFLLFLGLLIGLFSLSFAISTRSFGGFEEKLKEINIFTDIQGYSTLLSLYTRVLDMSRQEFELAEPVSYYTQEMQDIVLKMKDSVKLLRDRTNVKDMENGNVPCIEYEPIRGYSYKLETTVDAALQQISYAQKLLEDGVQSWDVENNQYAFWVFHNGMNSIANSLKALSDTIAEEAEAQRQQIASWAYWVAVMEISILVLLFVCSIPLLLKSERIHEEVVEVFKQMPPQLLRYLEVTTKNSLRMRKHSQYPEIRNRFSSDEEIWEEYILWRSKSKEVKSAEFKNDCTTKALRIAKNGLVKRLAGFVFITSCFVIGLQAYLGQIQSSNLLKNADLVVKDMGLLNVLVTRSDIFLMNLALSPYEVQAQEEISLVEAQVNNTRVYTPLTVENSFEKTLNETSVTKGMLYNFMTGSEELDLSFDYMHQLQKKYLLKYYLEQVCQGSSCVNEGGVFATGFFEGCLGYLFDLESLAYRIIRANNLTASERWELISPEVQNISKLDLKNLYTMIQELEEVLITYFDDMMAEQELVREIVLSFFVVFCVVYYLVLLRKSLNNQEKKKQLTRSMLMLLPDKVVAYSIQMQQALIRMNYD